MRTSHMLTQLERSLGIEILAQNQSSTTNDVLEKAIPAPLSCPILLERCLDSRLASGNCRLNYIMGKYFQLLP